jgi:hypothetical protein
VQSEGTFTALEAAGAIEAPFLPSPADLPSAWARQQPLAKTRDDRFVGRFPFVTFWPVHIPGFLAGFARDTKIASLEADSTLPNSIAS